MASRYEDRTVTGDFLDEVPNFDINIFSELEELPARFTEVSSTNLVS